MQTPHFASAVAVHATKRHGLFGCVTRRAFRLKFRAVNRSCQVPKLQLRYLSQTRTERPQPNADCDSRTDPATTSGSSAFDATRGQASSTCRSNEHQRNVRRTPTKRQHDINGTSTRHQRYVNRTSTKRQQNSNGSSTRQSTAVENSTYRDSMRHAVPFKMDASAGCSAGPSQCVTISPL